MKYLVVGLILMFITLVVVSAYSDISQFQPIRNQLDLFKSKVLNNQNEDSKININTREPSTAANYIINCIESTIVLENKQTTLEIDIDSTKEDCHVTFTMLRCVAPSFVDKSMTCRCRKDENELLSLCELISNPYLPEVRHITDLEGFKYCEGSLKVECFEGRYLLHDLSF